MIRESAPGSSSGLALISRAYGGALVLGAVAALVLGSSLVQSTPAFAASGCIPSGTDANINAALVGNGAVAELCANAQFSLGAAITFTAPNQVLRTQGLPTDATRATLTVDGAALATAVDGNGYAGVVVENIQVDGSRPRLGRIANSAALLEMGGAGNNQVVQNIRASDPRGWSVLHLQEGNVTNDIPSCQGVQVLNNTIGPSGTPDQWADGISLACGGALVKGNHIQDATDGAIVIFGAPGSLVTGNTIVAQNQTLLGGINLVDYGPVNGNYTGTRVENNVIDASGALIKVGIAMGARVWGCYDAVNYGASVTGNALEGGHMGYGYAVSGVRDFTITGNVDNSTHTGVAGSGCGGTPSEPSGFQKQDSTGTMQGEFVDGQLDYLLAVTEAPAGTVGIFANANNKFAFAGDDGSSPLVASSATMDAPELFDIVRESNNEFALQSRVNHLFVTTDDTGTNPLVAVKATVGPSEIFRFVRASDTSYGIQSTVSGLFVTVDDKTKELRASHPSVGGWEQFQFVSEGAAIPTAAAASTESAFAPVTLPQSMPMLAAQLTNFGR